MTWLWAIMIKSNDQNEGRVPMNLKPLSIYLIDYGTHTKLATFTSKQKNINHFFDTDGVFSFSDEFIKRGRITITEMKDDEEGIF